MTEQPTPLLVDFHLLDRQIIDSEGELVGKVDDVELAVDADGRLQVVALLAGQYALGERIGGFVGRTMAAIARRLDPVGRPEPMRIDYTSVDRVEAEIKLLVKRNTLPTPPLEQWLSEKFIGKIPGAGHAGT
jgi:sporulation protein YlmC with PRC-barrel domain